MRMHRAHKIALTAMSATLLSILLGLAHLFSMIFPAARFWFGVSASCLIEYTIITFLIWKF